MSLLDKIEKKFKWLSFSNLYLYLSIIFLLGLAMVMINPFFYYFYLSLDVSKILAGQFWRIFTFIFYPPSVTSSILLSLLLIYVYYSITKTLTMMWGNFKINLYLLIGFLSQIIGAFIAYFLFGNII